METFKLAPFRKKISNSANARLLIIIRYRTAKIQSQYKAKITRLPMRSGDSHSEIYLLPSDLNSRDQFDFPNDLLERRIFRLLVHPLDDHFAIAHAVTTPDLQNKDES